MNTNNIFNNFIQNYNKIILYTLCFYLGGIVRYAKVGLLEKVREIIIHENFYNNEQIYWFDNLKISEVNIGYFDSYWKSTKLAIKISIKTDSVPKYYYVDAEDFNNLSENDLIKIKVKAISKIDNWISELNTEKERRNNILNSKEYQELSVARNKLKTPEYMNILDEPTLNT